LPASAILKPTNWNQSADTADIDELKTLDQQSSALYRFNSCAADPGQLGSASLTQFVKVMPSDYKRVLTELAAGHSCLTMMPELPEAQNALRVEHV
jgi:hypothetical protein